MRRTMLKSKIHLAQVTETFLEYEGSLAVDMALLDAADMIPYERVWIADVDNGARFDTYLIEAERGSGTVMVNGAAARLVNPGDRIIIFSYTEFEDAVARGHRPIKVFPKNGNRAFDVQK